jgi:hypothetical protein
LKTFCEKLIKIYILLSHVNVNKMGMVTSPSEQEKLLFFKHENNICLSDAFLEEHAKIIKKLKSI